MSIAAASQIDNKKGKRVITLDRFIERYTHREDPFKYEWNNGVVEKKERTMNRDQFLILQKLLRLFTSTKMYAQGALLAPEVDMFLSTNKRTRLPDIAYLSPEQMAEVANGYPSVCPFVIEIISKNDQINEVGEKLIEYFENGVQVVWVVFPKIKKVEVYTSIKNVTICFDSDICIALPVLDDFKISVSDLLS